ncbi:MAG: methyltransferase domain-containing protein [Chloroflexi bacterium]|nr:methyltransferase domain-containing protein [Chloroflexota bacterium]
MSAPYYNPANIERYSGFSDTYDRYRPQPPAILIDILTQLAAVERPALVVDVGSGTGLSTRLWAGRADQVIGIEPGDDMRRQAEAQTAAPSVRYQPGYSTATGLPDACADIVTVSQALHWMEPEPTFAEMARILRPGGVFAAFDCDWPPTMHWEAEAAYNACMARVDAINRERGFTREVRAWAKGEHLDRMRASGVFRHTREIVLHHVEMGHADRLVGLALTQGRVATVLKHGVTEADAGITELRAVAARTLGDEPRPWYWSYRVRLGMK